MRAMLRGAVPQGGGGAAGSVGAAAAGSAVPGAPSCAWSSTVICAALGCASSMLSTSAAIPPLTFISASGPVGSLCRTRAC